MSIVFAHDHKFRMINGKMYSPGGLPNDVFARYTSIFGNVTVIARIIKENKENPKYSQITNSRVDILEKYALKDAVGKADGVIARLPSVIGSLAIREAKKQKKPYLVEAVGCAWDAYWNYGLKGKVIAPFAYLLMKIQVKQAPFVLYVTNHFLQNRYPTKGRQTNCSNVNIPKTDETVLNNRLEKIVEEKAPVIIGTTAAIDVPYKGQRFVIDALKIEKAKGNTRFLYQLVGGGDSSGITEYAKQLGLEAQVEILGSMPHEKVIDWLDTIDIYVQPSLTEGLPRAMIEAMSRGLPCIGTNVGGVGELLDEKYIISTKKKSKIGSLIGEALIKLKADSEMEDQAKKNFYEANSYIDTIIDDRRTAFFQEFKKTF